MKKRNSKLTAAQQAELDSLGAMPEEEINTKAVPEQHNWGDAKRGVFLARSKSN